ncbi:MAG: Uma2 family endonuclease, partial [Cyanobacteria bacterium P01_A01_bin.40]
DIIHDGNYELENGLIKEMPPESWQNLQIIMYLITEITKIVPYQQVTNKAEIIISGSRVTARVPDLIVLTSEGAAELAKYKRSTITLDMPPPLLVVEVVSPGKQIRDRDYRFKRSEYAARGIKYYWIIDPLDKKFICLELENGLYEERMFDSYQEQVSFEFPLELEIKFANIFFE